MEINHYLLQNIYISIFLNPRANNFTIINNKLTRFEDPSISHSPQLQKKIGSEGDPLDQFHRPINPISGQETINPRGNRANVKISIPLSHSSPSLSLSLVAISRERGRMIQDQI